ncbi:MAG: glycosyltransferase family 39 protein [Proteobacteria bacterium]|nr:glycosyltransferase family 39 protein [Pseudomonadota bacterium]
MLSESSLNLIYLSFIICSIVTAFFFIKLNTVSSTEDDSRLNKLSVFLLTFALLFGTYIRFYCLDFGLPTPYHPDEWQKARLLRKMMERGTLNPNFHALPPLLLYLSWLMESVIDLLGFYPNRTMLRILLAGRAVNAICGSISIFLLYLIGKHLYSRFIGSLAAFFLAINPLHITNSRYMKEDALFLLFVLLTAYFVVRVVNEKKLSYLYLASFLAGIACGAKYTGCVTVVMILAVPWLIQDRIKIKPDIYFLKRTLFALVLMPIGLILTLPYTIGDYEALTDVINGFLKESKHAMEGHQGLIISAASQYWMYHFGRSVVPALGWLISFFSLAAIGVAIRNKEMKLLWVAGIVLLFYLPAEWAQSKPPPQPDRYIIACIPFLLLLCSVLIERVCRGRVVVLASLILALTLQPLYSTITLASEIKNDTRAQMTEWMRNNLPKKTKIITAGELTYLPKIPKGIKAKSLRKVISKDRLQILEQIRASGYQYIIATELTNPRFIVESELGAKRFASMKMMEDNFELVKEWSAPSGQNGFHNPVLKLFLITPTH